MPTQLEYAKAGVLTPQIKAAAAGESLPAKTILTLIKDGRAVIPYNNNHTLEKPCIIGTGLKTKINANIGTSTDESGEADEIEKLKIAVRYGADAIMDLSVGGNLTKIRKGMRARCPVPLGTVPVYEIAVNAQKLKKNFLEFDKDDIFAVLRQQAQEGVDFFTIHAGVTHSSLKNLKTQKRILGVVSRGGAILAGWIKRHKKENPFYQYFDQILDIAYEHDVTLSLGDGLRPGSIWDATDKAQIAELRILGELAQRAQKKNVQVMIEGPGHVPLHQIKKNILLEKKICHGAPFYVLGPLVTDIAPGYDHITSAIGGALAASYGADFLCYVTPSEHLRHPSVLDVKEGVIASKIAAHAADIAKNIPGVSLIDKKMSLARKNRDWKTQIKLSLDPEKARELRGASDPKMGDVCTMCGDYCSIKIFEECMGKN